MTDKAILDQEIECVDTILKDLSRIELLIHGLKNYPDLQLQLSKRISETVDIAKCLNEIIALKNFKRQNGEDL